MIENELYDEENNLEKSEQEKLIESIINKQKIYDEFLVNLNRIKEVEESCTKDVLDYLVKNLYKEFFSEVDYTTIKEIPNWYVYGFNSNKDFENYLNKNIFISVENVKIPTIKIIK